MPAMRSRPPKPLLPVDPEAEGWCDARLAPTLAPAQPRPIALITPGAGWGAKRWPPERYAAVARGLADRGLRVLVNAGPGEESLAAPIVAAGAATPLSATLPQLIALTRRIALCIAGDTGPLHLASALGRPVVGIYGPTDPSRNGPYGTRARVLRSPDSRRDHSRRSEPDPGLLTITPEDVLARRRRIARRGARPDDRAHSPCQKLRSIAIAAVAKVARRIRVPLGFVTAACLSLRGARGVPASSRHRVEPGAGAAWPCVARRRIRHGQEESRAHRHRPLRVHAQSALSGLHAHRRRFCGGAAQLAAGAAARRRLRRHLHSGHRFGGAIPSRCTFPGFDDYCRSVPRFIPRLTPAKLNAVKSSLHSDRLPVTSDAPGGFSFALYLKHREYNAALGAALLYLSLLFLRPALEADPAPGPVSASDATRVQHNRIRSNP